MNESSTAVNDLLVGQDLQRALQISWIVAILMTAASLIGLVDPTVYATPALLDAFLANDAINILVGLPVLLGAMALARRGSWLGLLFWPGALFFVLYNYIIYAVAMPFSLLYLLYPVLVAASGYLLVRLVAGMDGSALQARLGGALPERFGGGVLAVFGAMYLLRALTVLVGMFTNQGEILKTEVGLNIADVILSLVWVFAGISLWRRRVFGYKSGLALLLQGSALFVGLILLMVLQPYLTGTVFPLADIIFVAVMGLIFFVPFGLFVRGTLRACDEMKLVTS